MNGADARAGEHGEHRFRAHRHVDDDAIAFADAEIVHDRGERRDFVELAVGELASRR